MPIVVSGVALLQGQLSAFYTYLTSRPEICSLLPGPYAGLLVSHTFLYKVSGLQYSVTATERRPRLCPERRLIGLHQDPGRKLWPVLLDLLTPQEVETQSFAHILLTLLAFNSFFPTNKTNKVDSDRKKDRKKSR